MKNGTYKMLLIALLTLTFSSCNNDDDNNELFNAVVIGKGLDCGDSFLIKFNENTAGLPNSIDNTYYEINLPNEFKVAGKEIKVDFREPKENEYFPCTTIGIGYNLIYIIAATSK